MASSSSSESAAASSAAAGNTNDKVAAAQEALVSAFEAAKALAEQYVQPRIDTGLEVWNEYTQGVRVVVLLFVFVLLGRALAQSYRVGPITVGYLVVKAAHLASAAAVFCNVADWNDPVQLVQVATAFLAISRTVRGDRLIPYSLVFVAFLSETPYVLSELKAIVIGHFIVQWLQSRAIQTISVNLDPKLPEQLEKVDKEFRIDSRPGVIVAVNPGTNEVLGTVPVMDEETVNAKVAAAAAAQRDWVRTSFDERRHVLRVMQQWILSHQEEIITLCCLDSGKSRVAASVGEVLPTCEKIAWVIREGEQALDPSPRDNGPGLMSTTKCGWVEYMPHGVLGVIAPWNYPFHNFMNHIVSGLFSGNAVVAKPSEFTSWSGGFFVDFVKEVLRSCGHSPDLVQCVTGFADTGRALVACKDVKKIIFTGSGMVGKHVMRGAAANLTPVILELGGKDPAIVCNDANLNQLVPLLMRGAFQNAGQNCMGLERVYAHTSVYQQVAKMCEERTKQLHQNHAGCGRACDVGSMVTPPQLKHVDELVRDAIANGAIALCGGKIAESKDGYFYEPTLLVNVKNEMRIVQEEVFGPVMLMIEWTTDEEVIRMANDTDYGLAMSVFSASRARAEHIVRSVHSGVGNVNDFGCNYLMQGLPFGGVKGSGFGRFGGPEGLRECCYAKSMTGDLIPVIQTNVPPILQYPMSRVSERFLNALTRLSYSLSWGERLSAITGVLGNLKK